MNHADDLRRCRECNTVFEAGVADVHPVNGPRCPQCFLYSSDPAGNLKEREMVIRQSTPFR